MGLFKRKAKFLDLSERYRKQQKRAEEMRSPQAYTPKGHENLQAGPETFSAKIFTKGKIFNEPVDEKFDLDSAGASALPNTNSHSDLHKEDISQEDIDKIIFGKSKIR